MNKNDITYCVTVANEEKEIKKLLPFLFQQKKPNDNVVVLLDTNKCHETDIQDYLYKLSSKDLILLIEDKFQNHFSDWKNRFFNLPTDYKRDWLFFIDADELPSMGLMKNIHTILGTNPKVDIFRVPRVNTIENIDMDYIHKWGWRVDTRGRINYPDYQSRICRNKENIKWVGNLHEVLTSEGIITELPKDYNLDLYHPKTMQRQIIQNTYYDKL